MVKEEKMRRKSDFLPIGGGEPISTLRNNKKVQFARRLLKEKLPEDCHLKNWEFKAVLLIAKLLNKTGQDIISKQQICAQCPITKCKYK